MAIKSGYTAEDLARLGPDALTRKRMLAEALLGDATKQRKIENPLQGLAQMADALVSGLRIRKMDAAEQAGQKSGDSAWSQLFGGAGSSTGAASMPSPQAANEISATDPGNFTGNQVFGDFMDTVKGSITNPFGLAAVAATGRAESGYDPKKAISTWSDPSESGQPGRSGGIMSWRGPRYEAMAASGDLSPTAQAKFFLQENPQLIEGLNNAKSVEEAQALMNNAWKFAGYNRPGGEADRRLGYAKGFLPSFQTNGAQVASLDPKAGMAAAAPQVASAPQAAPQAAPQSAPQPQQLAQALMNPQAPQSDTGPSLQALSAVLSNPWVSDDRKKIAQALLGQRLDRQNSEYEQWLKQSDPVYQQNLQKGALEIENLQHPPAKFITGRDGAIFKADEKAGTVQQIYGGKPDLPTNVQEYEYAKKQGYPGTFQEFQLEGKKAGASQVNIDQKTEGAFDKKLAENQANAFDTMATEGMNARSDLAVINELGSLLTNKGGTLDGISAALSKYGIGGEGVGDIQAAQALINKLIPTQRAPGSGSMSDRDVEMFQRSLPSLWNQPGGNEKILNTMRGLAQYKQAQGDIAQQVMLGDLTRQEGTKRLRELPNPLAGFEAPSSVAASKPPVGENGMPDFSKMSDGELRKFLNDQ